MFSLAMEEKNLGVTFDSENTFDKDISKVCMPLAITSGIYKVSVNF